MCIFYSAGSGVLPRPPDITITWKYRILNLLVVWGW